MKKKIFLGVYNLSIILTYISVFCSIYGIGTLLLPREGTVISEVTLAVILLVIAGVCDMFDGKIARMCKRTDKEKEFGVQLDSLADTVSFVVFPAVLLLYITQMHIVSIIIAMFYVFAGIMRLGWFNVTAEENKGYFFGLPVTFAALIFPAFHLVAQFAHLSVRDYVYQILYAVIGIAFICNFRFKKPGLKFSIVMVLAAIAVIACLIIF